MQIRANERVLFAGRTGSGKTFLARQLLAASRRLVVIDAKGTLNDWNATEPDSLAWYRFLRGGEGRLRILPPITDDPAGWYEKLFEELYEAGTLTLYIDEAYAVVPPGTRAGKWLNALYTRGRERGIGVWAATQRPAWIPLFMISEADWVFAFRLSLVEDRQRLAAIAGEKLLEPPRSEHGFWMYHVSMDDPALFGSVEAEAGRA
jgi:DNA helicase HerA-like ATPase